MSDDTSAAMVLAENASWISTILLVVALLYIAQSCNREHDQRVIGCALRWSHAVSVSDSITVAGRCGSEGLMRSVAKR